MPSIEDYNRYGEELEKWLRLKTSPVAVRMLESETDIPQGAVRPRKDRGYHLAQCQAFALSRRNRETVAMMKEDNWCPAPVTAYGMEPRSDDPAARASMKYDSFEAGKYAGIVTAPLEKANFEPDVVIIYLNTAQLRTLLLTMTLEERDMIDSYYFPPSCAHAVVSPVLNGRYHIVLPDPGEYARALCGEDEMMFAVPGEKLEALVSDIKKAMESGGPFFNESMIMRPDFPQPDLYKHIFKDWGMDYEK